MKQEENSWFSITEHIDNNYLDFSVNTNALGIPDTIRQNISNVINAVGFYPDSDCSTLSAALAEKYKISSNCLLCGNGADELLYRLVFALNPHKALIIEPTFEEYSRALELIGCSVYHYQLSPINQFKLDQNVLSVITNDLDILFLCNPNNPTGNLVCEPLMGAIYPKTKGSTVLEYYCD